MTDLSAYTNRLAKNARHRSRWAKRQHISCYRLYDCDVPEFPLVVDWYQTDRGVYLHLQEVDTGWQQSPEEHRQWIEFMTLVSAETLGLEPMHVVFKRRVRQRVGKALEQQYQASGHPGQDLIVEEGGHRFLINLEAYLDTGLFLDHRITRGWVGARAAGRRMLNLFAYTGSFTVYAARGGACTTTSVDLSNTYCQWAERNLRLNGIAGVAHRVLRADVLSWLNAAKYAVERYDLIVLDPPSFSNSKRMHGVLDVQRDHGRLISQCMDLLAPSGELFFSTNLRSFHLSADLCEQFEVQDLSRRSVPEDFRDTRIHRTFLITAPSGRSTGAGVEKL